MLLVRHGQRRKTHEPVIATICARSPLGFHRPLQSSIPTILLLKCLTVSNFVTAESCDPPLQCISPRGILDAVLGNPRGQSLIFFTAERAATSVVD